ncbi:MAG: hypothetical protein RIQ64_1611 [Actinomycetota bacterium]
MRQVLTWRFALAIGVPLIAALAWWLIAVRAAGDAAQSERTHFVSYTASVVTVQADPNWAVKNGLTTGTARLALDDGRTLYVAEATLGEILCTDFSTPNACVLLAEMLGDAPIWFALTPASGDEPLSRLPLPPVVDMLNEGDHAVLENGWVVPLATPTKRECETATANLREFIERFGPDMEVSLDLSTDAIDTVRCTAD